MDTFLERKKLGEGVIGWALFVIWQTVLNTRVWEMSTEGIMSENHPEVNVWLSLAAMEAVGVWAYRGKVWKRLMFPVIYGALWMMAEGLALFGVGYISEREPSVMVCVLVSHTMMLVMVLGIRCFMQSHGMDRYAVDHGRNLLIIPLIGIEVYYMLYKIARYAGTEKREIMRGLSIAALLLIIADLYVYIIYEKMIEGYGKIAISI